MIEAGDSSRVSVIGLGKLGAPIATTFAAKGHRVVAVDTDAERVSLVNAGRPPVFEPGLGELLAASRGRLVATEDLEQAIQESDITFIVVPTPSDPAGGFSLRYVLSACEGIGKALRRKDYHLVVLTSTVLPGSTEREVLPLLEAQSEKRCGRGFGLCYSPEFIALGSVIHDLLNPDFILIGESDPRAGDVLAAFYRSIPDNQPAVARMNLVNAEITKLAVNTFVTTKITFANMVARICERLPHADADVVTSALGLDSRIGRKYLKGAIGYGGPCFPRDNLALSFLANQVGAPATLAEATDQANREEVRRLAALVQSRRPPQGTVGILGLAYKAGSDVAEQSQGVLLARELLAQGTPVIVYDPAAMDSARRLLPDGIRFAESTEACVREADVLVLATTWEAFRRLQPAHLARAGAPRVLIDCWRILDQEGIRATVEYVPLGASQIAPRRGPVNA